MRYAIRRGLFCSHRHRRFDRSRRFTANLLVLNRMCVRVRSFESRECRESWRCCGGHNFSIRLSHFSEQEEK